MPQQNRGTLLATLLFTDIVGSTDLADQLGDRRWRELLARHHAIVRRELKRFNGRELDTAGDGFFAAFTKPAEAVRCAAATVDGVRELGIEIRAGLHVGEAEIFGAKLSGVTVHIAARTMAMAGPGEILVTGVLKDLVPGSGFRFEDRGVHQLKGVPGEWRTFALAGVDGQVLPPRLEPERQQERLESIQPPRVPRGARRPLIVVGVAVALAAVVTGLVVASAGDGPAGGLAGGPTNGTASPKGQLVAIDPVTRKPTATLSLDFTPGPVVFAEGSVWIVDESGNRVLRVSPATRRVEARIPVGKDPVDMTVGAGAIWVADHFGRSVSRIDPGTNKVSKTIDVDFLPVRIGANDGAVWVTDTGILGPRDPYPRSNLATIEPATNRVLDPVRFKAATDCAPFLGATTEDGWAATAFGEVWRLGERGGKPVVLTRTSEIALAGMLVDESHGIIWFGSDGSPGKVVSLDLATKDFSDPIFVGTTENRTGPGCDPIWVATGGSYLWVTNADDHTLSVIAVVSRQGVGTIPLGGKPTGLAFGANRVWVTVDLS
jgi:YVTN family beta-propeller protein